VAHLSAIAYASTASIGKNKTAQKRYNFLPYIKVFDRIGARRKARIMWPSCYCHFIGEVHILYRIQ